ncbi:hypothetical protein SUGI_0545330 [Cryptomeria japonica]|nr:hypothetical protein SUGI_0545330 [Cryptomeria japonica]
MARLNQSSPMFVFLILLLIVQVWNVSAHIIENDAKHVKTYGAEQGYGEQLNSTYQSHTAHKRNIVIRNILGDALRHHRMIGVSGVVEYVVANAIVFLLVHMATKKFALAMPI